MSSKNSIILITGASGFVGNHVVNEFLQHGYQVRVTVRSKQSGLKLVELHKSANASIDYVLVPDITAPGAFDDAVKGIDGVIHMASTFKIKVDDNERDLLIPAIYGTNRILEAVTNHAPKVKRVVITSSFAAVNDFSKGLNPGYRYTEMDWNPMDYKAAKEDKIGLAYAGSKKLGEAAAWNFMRAHKDANFALATINPPMIYGPSFPSSIHLKHLGQSPGEIYALMNGSLKQVPPAAMPAFVDVRDVALAHLKAYETDQPGRFLVASGKWSPQQVCDLFRQSLPQIQALVPVGNPGSAGPECYVLDTTRARVVLGIKFRTFEETFLDMAMAFLEMENAESKQAE